MTTLDPYMATLEPPMAMKQLYIPSLKNDLATQDPNMATLNPYS